LDKVLGRKIGKLGMNACRTGVCADTVPIVFQSSLFVVR